MQGGQEYWTPVAADPSTGLGDAQVHKHVGAGCPGVALLGE